VIGRDTYAALAEVERFIGVESFDYRSSRGYKEGATFVSSPNSAGRSNGTATALMDSTKEGMPTLSQKIAERAMSWWSDARRKKSSRTGTDQLLHSSSDRFVRWLSQLYADHNSKLSRLLLSLNYTRFSLDHMRACGWTFPEGA